VEIDGIDVRSLRLEALRNRVAMVAQPEPFEGTIRDNVLMGRSLATEDVHEALRRTGLLEPFAELSDGLDTRLTSAGHPLSDAQIHRLMLARAIVGAPGLLLVDDSSLDGMSREPRERILGVLTDAEAPWTLILVSNRGEVLQRCDRLVELAPASARLEVS
jgi:ABC-type multidrug transport system fused ATPase/permease subunit